MTGPFKPSIKLHKWHRSIEFFGRSGEYVFIREAHLRTDAHLLDDESLRAVIDWAAENLDQPIVRSFHKKFLAEQQRRHDCLVAHNLFQIPLQASQSHP